MPELRDYQQLAIDAVVVDWAATTLNTLVAHATGLGKTVTAINLLKQQMKPGERAIWIAHRDELLAQPLARFAEWWPESQFFSGIVKAKQNDVGARLIFASIQTVSRTNRLEQLINGGPIDYLVYDECHHAVCDSAQRFINGLREANPAMKHVGMSATPWRSDGVGMIKAYDHIASQRGILWGVEHGWLVPPRGQQVQTDVSLAGIKLVAGDFAKGQLQEVLSAAGWHHLVARAYVEHGEDRQALAYTPGVQTSKELCEALIELGVSAAHIDGTTPKEERRATIKAFREREIKVLCNCMIVVEGFDAPSTECVLMARPTKSHGLLTQIIGRGLRPYPGKEDCLVLLFATTDAHILTLYDLGKSKKLKKAQERAEMLGVEGFSEPIELFDREQLDGAGLYANAVSLFAQSSGAWFRDGATFSLGLGKDAKGTERTLVILPPGDGDEWRLIGLGRKQGGKWQDYEIIEHSEIDTVMLMANEIAERRGASILYEKSKRWRKQPASKKQIAVLKKFGVVPLGLSKGDCSRLLNHRFALSVLQRKGYEV
jgi:superfamily II DNA or RNA helicase